MPKHPKLPPKDGARKVIVAFFTEFIPSVETEFNLLQKAVKERLRLSLFDLQGEALVFGLHCLDMDVMAQFGTQYQEAFMDVAVPFTAGVLASEYPKDRDEVLKRFEALYNTRQHEYAAMQRSLGDNPRKGTLLWEYSKRICLKAGVHDPPALEAMIDEGDEILRTNSEVNRDALTCAQMNPV